MTLDDFIKRLTRAANVTLFVDDLLRSHVTVQEVQPYTEGYVDVTVRVHGVDSYVLDRFTKKPTSPKKTFTISKKRK